MYNFYLYLILLAIISPFAAYNRNKILKKIKVQNEIVFISSAILVIFIIVQIVSKGCFTLVTRDKENLDKIINEQKLQHSGLTSNALAVELGQLLNTQYIIIPNMTKIGKSYSFTAKLINVESGQIIRAASFINRLLEIDAYVEKCTRHIAAEICG